MYQSCTWGFLIIAWQHFPINEAPFLGRTKSSASQPTVFECTWLVGNYPSTAHCLVPVPQNTRIFDFSCTRCPMFREKKQGKIRVINRNSRYSTKKTCFMFKAYSTLFSSSVTWCQSNLDQTWTFHICIARSPGTQWLTILRLRLVFLSLLWNEATCSTLAETSFVVPIQL